ncbi:MAG: leucine-rich repeat protein [Clostridia bacterium]|nr:leucine-rich repeat protein [Clostridia bacterium]
MKKLILASVLAVALIALLSFACAEHSGTWGSLSWTLNAAGVLTISGSGDIADLEFYGEDAWLAYTDDITQVIVSEGITSIGDNAFQNAFNLTGISLPSGLTRIGDAAFYSCESLGSISIPGTVASIGKDAFRWCSALTGITIPNGVTEIAADTFYHCESLTNIIIPGSVTNIRSNAFAYCSALENIAIPNSVTSIGEYVFEGCSSLKNISIPNSVTSIGYGAFYNCSSLTYLPLPDSITDIRRNMFYGCDGLTEITIPSGIKSIGYDAFYLCENLTKVSIPASVSTIDVRAFQNCTSLTEIVVDTGNSVYASYLGAVYNTALTELLLCPDGKTSITFPNSLTGIGNYAFSYYSRLASITIPSGLTSINCDEVFDNCHELTNITVDSANPAFASYLGMLYDKTLTQLIKCPNGKTYAIVADSAVSAAPGAFNGCYKLTTLNIANLTDIDSNTFSYCYALNTLKVNPANPQYASRGGLLCDKAGSAVILCPKGLTSVTVPDGITEIQNSAFAYGSIVSVTLPDSLTRIWDNAFYECEELTGIRIPESVTEIGDDAFAGCWKLKTLTLPAHMEHIGAEAFANCGIDRLVLPEGITEIALGACTASYVYIPASLEEIDVYSFHSSIDEIEVSSASRYFAVYSGMLFNKDLTELIYVPSSAVFSLPASYTVIGDSAFSGTYFENVVIPGHVTAIGDDAFHDCYSLRSVSIPGSVASIGAYAFYSCGNLSNVTLGNGVTTIGDYAFWNTSISSIVLPDSVVSIGDHAFDDCYSLVKILIPASVTSIGEECVPAGTTIRCYENSYAAEWASENGCTTEYIVECAHGHTEEITTQEATCGSDGLKLIVCSDCGAVLDEEVIPATGEHVFYTESGDPTCTEGGYVVDNCENCGYYIIRAEYPPLGHTAVTDRAVAPTWNEPGLTEGSHCSVCEEIIVRQTALVPLKYSDALLTLPANLSVINAGAFTGISQIDAIVLPAGVTSIAANAFEPGTLLVVPAGSPWAQWACDNGYTAIEMN